MKISNRWFDGQQTVAAPGRQLCNGSLHDWRYASKGRGGRVMTTALMQ